MPEDKNALGYQPMTFDSIKIELASPQKIREWSTHTYGDIVIDGVVTKPETINYRTLKPERDGLFCERIFGPTKDYECHCGKYKKSGHYIGKVKVCDNCGVEITKQDVRRERMGRIELMAPVSHIWYFKGVPSRMALLLDIAPKALERVLYFESYIVLEKSDEIPDSEVCVKQVITEAEYKQLKDKYKSVPGAIRAQMGAEAIKELLLKYDSVDGKKTVLQDEADSIRSQLMNLKKSTDQKRAKFIKRLEVIEAFLRSDNEPSWMIMDCVPVMPPDLRPMVQLDGGRFATSDLNDLYRRIINRNNRLGRLLELGAPEIIVRNEKRMLQEAVDALIDNGRRGRAVTGAGNRELKSLSSMLKGKQGRFRQNLLGKRVDYSGRSVIVVGPELKIYQCGLPKEMAIELFKPFVEHELVLRGLATNPKNARKMIEKLDPVVWDILEDVIKEHPVMLNRAPTLHRLGIQAFEPILVEGRAIRLHPLACMAFNADFDGDQMAVHLPLSVEAQAECRFMLLSPNNLLKPSDGGIVAVPSQDMVLGVYYLTQERPGAVGEGKFFKDVNEAVMAYENKVITLQSRIKVRITKNKPDGTPVTGIVESTLGRFIFNEIIPQDLGYVDRSKPENFLLPEVDHLVKKGDLKNILNRTIKTHGATVTAEVLDNIKATGYKYSTIAAMTVSISDMIVPAEKKAMIAKAERDVEWIGERCKDGWTTEEERYRQVIDVWRETDNALKKKMKAGLGVYNNLNMMADSGARGSDDQIKQLAGMRGLMAKTTGETIELPIKSNFREGLDVLEYFMSAHGARKGMSDTALRTADSGYLTRRLVDVAQEIIIYEKDCVEDRIERLKAEGKPFEQEIPYMEISEFADNGNVIESLQDRITGRVAAETIVDPSTGEVIVETNQMITPSRAGRVIPALEASGRSTIKIRSVLSCRCHTGVCAKCYGANLATGQPVQVGEAVGVIAAQSIGEPGTQLTMRTFHSGGVAGTDITQGLPRVEELFEARKPKGVAKLAVATGTLEIPHYVDDDSLTSDQKQKKFPIYLRTENEVITIDDLGKSPRYVATIAEYIKDEDNLVDGKFIININKGDRITEGSIDPHDMLAINGVRAAQDYILSQVQSVYHSQSVDINDKHIEVIVHQMLKRVRIEDAGDSDVMPGTTMGTLDFNEMNEKLEAEGKKPAVCEPIILGITKASLATASFLSAASFQETTRVLTDAAINGRVDNLTGLKENVILGKLIPAGTGMKRYRNMHLTSDLVTPAPSMDPVEEDIELREQHELEEKNAKERDKKIKRIKEEDDDQKGVDLHAILEKLSEDVGDYADEDFDDSDLDDDDLDDLGEPNLDMLKDQDDSDE